MQIEIGIQPNHSSWSWSERFYVDAAALKKIGICDTSEDSQKKNRSLRATLEKTFEEFPKNINPLLFEPRISKKPKGFVSIHDIKWLYNEIGNLYVNKEGCLVLHRSDGQGGVADMPWDPAPHYYERVLIQERIYQAWILCSVLGLDEIFGELEEYLLLKFRLEFKKSGPKPFRIIPKKIEILKVHDGLLPNFFDAVMPFVEAFGMQISFADPVCKKIFSNYYIAPKQIKYLEHLIRTSNAVSIKKQFRQAETQKLLLKSLRIPRFKRFCTHLLKEFEFINPKILIDALAASLIISGQYIHRGELSSKEKRTQKILKSISNTERKYQNHLKYFLLRQSNRAIAAQILHEIETNIFGTDLLSDLYLHMDGDERFGVLADYSCRAITQYSTIIDNLAKSSSLQVSHETFCDFYLSPILRALAHKSSSDRDIAHIKNIIFTLTKADCKVAFNAETLKALASSIDVATLKEIERNILHGHNRPFKKSTVPALINLMRLIRHLKHKKQFKPILMKLCSFKEDDIFIEFANTLLCVDKTEFVKSMKATIFCSVQPVEKRLFLTRIATSLKFWVSKPLTQRRANIAFTKLIEAYQNKQVTERHFTLTESFKEPREKQLWKRIRYRVIAEQSRQKNWNLDQKQVVKILTEALCDPDKKVRQYAALGLGKIGPEARHAVPFLIKCLFDHNDDVRWQTVRTLGKIGPAAGKAVPSLIEKLSDRYKEYRDSRSDINEEALTALGSIGPAAKKAIPNLLDIVKDNPYDLNRTVGVVLGRIGKASLVPLFRLLKTSFTNPIKNTPDDPKAAAAVAEALGITYEPNASKRDEDRDHTTEIHIAAIVAFGVMGPAFAAQTIPVLEKALDDPPLRYDAIRSLTEIGPAAKKAIPSLELLLRDKDQNVCKDAKKAIKFLLDS